ncbi:IS5/IS1182 family transposase, partial [Escherichia coli]|nr:IS5/IS1182 family transposase [Escherichia coli]MCM2858658.1 IS5/IS1182 family transposase [Escherichia coli]
MMGQLPGGQQRLFYSFNLEDHVPAQHLLRSIDQCLDRHCCKVSDEAAFCLIQRPYISKTLLT